MEELAKVRKFMSYFRGNVSAFTASTTDDVMEELVAEGYLECMGTKYDSVRRVMTKKYRRIRPENDII